MFSVETIELTDFKCYRGTHLITLPKAPGLYHLTGLNLVNPRVGSNAAGKSTILDAIHWAIFGRTARGLKSGDVVGWHAKSCSVTICVAVGDQKCTIKRTQNPNSLTLDEKPVDEVTKLIRMNEAAFDYAVMLPQFGTSFFDLTPANKLSLFTEILALDFWMTKSVEASKLATEIEAAKQADELTLAKVQGVLIATSQDIDHLKAKVGTFGKEKANNLEAMKLDLALLEREIPKHEKQLVEIKRALVGADNRISKLEAEDKTCPTCGQKIDNSDLKTIRQNRMDFSWAQRDAESKLLHLREKVTYSKQAIDAKANETNPYSEILKVKHGTLAEVTAQRNGLKDSIEWFEREHAAISYWVNGFKRIRLMIVEETLRQLEIEVNNNLGSLGLLDWRIEFDVERETKAGGISKGFVVFVHPSDKAEPVRFEAYSGGETQRLRMAGDLGLANLIMERAGLTNTIECIDEPSQHLSQEGLLDLAELLARRAETDEKRIFLVDHHVIEFGGFTGVMTVTKDEKGSHLTFGDV